ncbi:hypothetical protein HDU81_006461 [Chytriomyces hyalinus]|nr:hypothetical protein HDU81_006461 [Chytriomyces hyalinus]
MDASETDCDAPSGPLLNYDGYGREFRLSGELSVFGQLTELATLHVPGNAFFGPLPAFKTWKNLKRLDISFNANLTGSFPEFSDNMNEMYSHPSPFMEDLRFNQPLPLTYPQNLSVLSVGKSGFFGTIPTQLGKLTSLIKLELAKNQLSGPIPPELAQLRSLGSL